MKSALAGCGAVLGGTMILVLVLGTIIGGLAFGWGFSWVTAPIRGAVGAREKIQADPNFRLQAYEQFYNDCSSIMGLEADEDSQVSGYLSSAPGSNERLIYKQNIVGIEGTRGSAIARYNTDSHKQWAEAQFKSAALIYQIPTGPHLTYDAANDTWVKGASTVCVTN